MPIQEAKRTTSAFSAAAAASYGGKSRLPWENLVTLALFVLTLTTFTALTLGRSDDNAAAIENRVARPLPQLSFHRKSLLAYPAQFEAWFSDRFMFKADLVGARNFVLLEALATSGTKAVIPGKDNFLYWTEDDELELIRKSKPFSEAELATWKHILEGRAKWCSDHGMDYYYIVAPSKATIYPENIPAYYTQRYSQTRREQLLAYLRQSKAKVKVIDLAPAVIAHKQEGIRYYRIDTHWNQCGAYDAYAHIATEIAHQHSEIGEPLAKSNLYVVPFTFVNGDLARMLGLLGTLKDPNLSYGWHEPAKYKWVFYPSTYRNELKTDDTRPRAAVTSGSHQPTAIMFHDSFTCFLRMYLSCNFSKIGYFWQPDFDRALLLKEHPQLVLQEQIENKLYKEIPKN